MNERVAPRYGDPPFSLRLPPTCHDALDELARSEGRSKADVVRRFIDRGLAEARGVLALAQGKEVRKDEHAAGPAASHDRQGR